MGTLLYLRASGPHAEAVESALDEAGAAVDKVERLMSFHAEDSELTRLNRAAFRAPQRVDPWTFAVLGRARRIAALSDGLFDITVAPLLVRAGLLPPRTGTPPSEGNWRDVTLLPDGHVFFERPVLLDLGGIAKGFAVDQAIHALRRHGATEATVNAGGDLRRFGATALPVHLRRPDGLVTVAALRCGAVATSGGQFDDPEGAAQSLGHIFDPRRRRAWNGIGSVTVAASSCVVADALTKVAALAGPGCARLLDRFGARALWDRHTGPAQG